MELKTLIEQLSTIFNKFTQKQKIVIGLSTLAVVGFLMFLILYTNKNRTNDGYRTLFDNISPSDAALVIKQLEADNIPYKVVSDSVIKVPKEHVYKERIAISAQGIPKNSRIGFELFDTQNFGETDFAQNIKYLRALEGELSKSVESLTPIESAQVHIALPKESLFVEEETKPTASVILNIIESMNLSPKQIVGIKNLISASIPKLTAQNVKLINQNGDPLSNDETDAFQPDIIATQIKYKKDYEKAYEDKIIKLLSPIIGHENRVVAKVTIDFDFEQKDSIDEFYDPESVVRSEQTSEEKKTGASNTASNSGVPGAISNISPIEDKNKKDSTKQKHEKSTSTINYEISKKITNTKGQFATIKRVTASVVVDGKYIKNEDSEELEYQSLDADEISTINAIVKNSIGYDKKRGDEITVENLKFKISTAPKVELNQVEHTLNMINPFLPLLKYLFAAILLFIFYKNIITPFSEKMLQDHKPNEDEEDIEIESEEEKEENKETLEKYNDAKRRIEEELGIAGALGEKNLKHEVLLEKIRQSIDMNPEDAAKLIESILKPEKEFYK
jgi:flagellar M-ring protein FliF